MGDFFSTRLDLIERAHAIAAQHTKRGWFEAYSSYLVRRIRLRTAIYNALLDARKSGVDHA